jgi:tRNA 2-thiouridine synthesizing protein A
MPDYAIERDPLLGDERPDTLGKRVEVVLGTLAFAAGTVCHSCPRRLCAHDVLASVVLGFQHEPRCSHCLSHVFQRNVPTLRDEITAFAMSKECLTIGWRWAATHDAQCEWLRERTRGEDCAVWPRTEASASDSLPAPTHDAEWDAGDLACGELVLELRRRLLAMSPGQIIKVTALDPAAPEDMPAWCRLTGNPLVHSKHPQYFIRRKED